jgi:hypothetical protein
MDSKFRVVPVQSMNFKNGSYWRTAESFTCEKFSFHVGLQMINLGRLLLFVKTAVRLRMNRRASKFNHIWKISNQAHKGQIDQLAVAF